VKYKVVGTLQDKYIPTDGYEPFSVTISPAGNIMIWCRVEVKGRKKRKYHRKLDKKQI